MNELERKCAMLANTPQARWFDLRFKPTFQLLMNMNSEGTISLQQMNVPILQLMNIVSFGFKYDGEYYLFFINQIEGGTECFHLERTNSNYGNILSSHLVISSDDDPNEKMWLPYFALLMGVKTNTELISKLKSMII